MSAPISPSIRAYYQAYKADPDAGCERLACSTSTKNGETTTRYSLKNPTIMALTRIFCCCRNPRYAERNVLPLLERDLKIEAAEKARRSACMSRGIRAFVRAGIMSGLSEIKTSGYTGLVLQPQFWKEAMMSEHYGPLLNNQLYSRWERSSTDLSYNQWLKTEEGFLALNDALDIFRAHFELRSGQMEVHPETKQLVHVVDLEKLKVQYLSDEMREQYQVSFHPQEAGSSLLYRSDGAPLIGRFAYVIGPDQKVYVGRHVLNHFHHSSFFGGRPIIGAGKLETDETGKIVKINNDSGHYKPERVHFDESLQIFEKNGVDFSSAEVIFKDWKRQS